MQVGPFRVQHNLGELSAGIRRAVALSRQRADQCMMAVGIQTVSWVTQDFVAKARKGADAAGNTWKDIQPETVKNRVRRLATYKRLRDQKMVLRQEELALRTSGGPSSRSEEHTSELQPPFG